MKSAYSSSSRLLALGIVAAAAVAWAPAADAQLLTYDGFDYTSGALTGKGGTSDFGFSGAWYNPTGISGNITTGLERSPLIVGGAAVGMAGASTAINFRILEEPLSAANSAETWISLLGQRTGDTAAGNFAGLSFYSGGNGDAETEWAISTGSVSGQQQWRLTDLNNQNPGTDTPTGVVLANNRVDLLLAQVVWDVSGTHQVNLWINPPTVESALPAPITRNIAMPFFDRVRLASQNGAPFIFDELRLGENFEDVMDIFPPDPDVDGNGIDISDFDVIRNNYLTTNTHGNGDVDFSGFVDHADYFIWRQAFFAAGGSADAISWSPVPEPSSAALACASLIGGAAIGRTRRRRG